MNNNSNQVPFLRTSREFPEEDIHQLTVEIDRAYLDISNAVNARTIGIFTVNRSSVTGESWFLSSNRRQQSQREVYPFGAIAPGGSLSIPYKTNGFDQFSRIYGTCLTGQPDARPIPYASVSANANIDLRIDTVNLNIIIANGAASPAIVSGLIILEWLSQP